MVASGALRAEPRDRVEHGRSNSLTTNDIGLLKHPALRISPDSGRETGVETQLRLDKIQKIRRALISPGKDFQPFNFKTNDGVVRTGREAGLEDFIRTEKRFAEKFGKDASANQVGHYITYVSDLLSLSDITAKTLKDFKALVLQNSNASKEVLYDKVIEFLDGTVSNLQSRLRELDPARWCQQMSAYQIYVGAFNLKGFKHFHLGSEAAQNLTGKFFVDFGEPELQLLKNQGFNTIRLMGIYEVGEVNAKGTGEGSPFSLKRHVVDKKHGSQDEVRAFVRKAHELGIKVVFEFVPNHTSCDSQLLEEAPDMFVHVTEEPRDKRGYFRYDHPDRTYWIRYGACRDLEKGTISYWEDVLQLDFSNSQTRDTVCTSAVDILKAYGVDGLRVDSAYQMLHSELKTNWGVTNNNPKGEFQDTLPNREFLDILVTRIKQEHPGCAIMAEAFAGWGKLSNCGFDLIYGDSTMDLQNGKRHQGWHAALESGQSTIVSKALERSIFLNWQQGGADMLVFFGQHDKTAPWHDYGDWMWGVAPLTILRPGPFNFYAGVDANYENPCDEIGFKMITFNKPSSIDWAGVDTPYGNYFQELLKIKHDINKLFPSGVVMQMLPSGSNDRWVGYELRDAHDKNSKQRVIVLANPTKESVEVNTMSSNGNGISTILRRSGPGCAIVCFDPPLPKPKSAGDAA